MRKVKYSYWENPGADIINITGEGWLHKIDVAAHYNFNDGYTSGTETGIIEIEGGKLIKVPISGITFMYEPKDGMDQDSRERYNFEEPKQ